MIWLIQAKIFNDFTFQSRTNSRTNWNGKAPQIGSRSKVILTQSSLDKDKNKYDDDLLNLKKGGLIYAVCKKYFYYFWSFGSISIYLWRRSRLANAGPDPSRVLGLRIQVRYGRS